MDSITKSPTKLPAANKNFALSKRVSILHPSAMSVGTEEQKIETIQPRILNVGSEREAVKSYYEKAKILVG